MDAMLRDPVVVVAVVQRRPGAISLAMITIRKSIHGFRFRSFISMGLRLQALSGCRSSAIELVQRYRKNSYFSATYA